jgi:hypothetical protein
MTLSVQCLPRRDLRGGTHSVTEAALGEEFE